MRGKNRFLCKGALAKLKETAGETLVETLFAMTIIVLVFAFFPTAVMAATNVVEASEDSSGTCPNDRSSESVVTTETTRTYVTFKSKSTDQNPTGKWTDITWQSGTPYNLEFDSSGNHLVSTDSAGDQNSIDIKVYKNSAEGGSSTPDYYFYDVK